MQNLSYESVTTARGRVGYVTTGSGYPLILIVGYSGTLFHWNRSFINKLAESFNLYLIDNRYIGKSISTNENTINGMAQDVIDFIEAMQIVKPIIFGWSMGGVITQQLLVNYQHNLAGAVLFATTYDQKLISADFVELIANQEHIPPHEFKRQLYATFFSEDDSDKIKLTIKDGAILIDDYNYRYNFEAKELQDTAVESWVRIELSQLNQILLPVLVMRAKNDLVVDSSVIEYFTHNLPNAKAIIYPSGGHFFLHKSPLQIASDIANFFINQSI